jgi:hypothetical protein
MSIESIKARLGRHDRQRMRYGYSDETAPQIWERELRALLKVAEAAKRVNAALSRRNGEEWREGLTLEELDALCRQDMALAELEAQE